MRIRLVLLAVAVVVLAAGGCNFGNNKALKDQNRDSSTKAQKAAGGADDTSTP